MPELGYQLRGWTLRLLVLPRGGGTGPAGPARHPVPAGLLPAAAGPLPGAAAAPHHRPAAVGLASRGARCRDRRNRPRPPHHPAGNPARLPQVSPAMLLQYNKTSRFSDKSDPADRRTAVGAGEEGESHYMQQEPQESRASEESIDMALVQRNGYLHDQYDERY